MQFGVDVTYLFYDLSLLNFYFFFHMNSLRGLRGVVVGHPGGGRVGDDADAMNYKIQSAVAESYMTPCEVEEQNV